MFYSDIYLFILIKLPHKSNSNLSSQGYVIYTYLVPEKETHYFSPTYIYECMVWIYISL